MDRAYEETDEALEQLEQRIRKVYREAAADLQKTLDEYTAGLEQRDAAMRERLDAGEIDEAYYKKWRLAQEGRGKHIEAMRDKVAERVTNAKKIAVEYINEGMPDVYVLNHNYTAYSIEQLADVDFTMLDEAQVKNLIVNEPDLMPYYPEERAVRRGIDLAYGKKQITACVTSGILTGKSNAKIAADLQDRIIGMSFGASMRAARTAYGEAQNAGRQAAYDEAAKMGVKMKKRWMAVHDWRTRYSHAHIDQETVDLDATFSNGLMYPNDMNGAPSEVYNCRCAVVGIVAGSNQDKGETYEEWLERKKTELGEDVVNAKIKAARNTSTDEKQYAEYKSLLGKDAPKTLAKFQELKYTQKENWEYTKGLAAYLRANPTSKKNYYDAYLEIKKISKNAGIPVPIERQRAYILKHGKRHPAHIMERMLERHITDDEVRSYSENARVMFKQCKGAVRLYMGDEGCSVMQDAGEHWVYKTTYTKYDFDENTINILRVLDKYGIR